MNNSKTDVGHFELCTFVRVNYSDEGQQLETSVFQSFTVAKCDLIDLVVDNFPYSMAPKATGRYNARSDPFGRYWKISNLGLAALIRQRLSLRFSRNDLTLGY